ncbi:MAG TPA: IS110 family transposase [Acidobacteriaceae bacterium]
MKSRVPEQRDAREVMAELVAQLTKQLDTERLPVAESENGVRGAVCPNLVRLTVGVDLGDQWSNDCILGLGGETLAEGQFRTRQQEIAEFFQGLTMSRVVFEVGTHSAWVREIIAGLGHEVLVANPRQMQGSKRRRRKNDRIDAAKLARLGRVDPKSLYPIQHRSTQVREDLVVLRARDALVASRTELINTVRGLVKTMGARLCSCSSFVFSKRVESEIPEELRETLQPLLRLITRLNDEIKVFDQRIEKLASEKYMHTKLLRQVPGVGPVTALAYVLTLETPLRFAKSRDVGPYLGLVPKQEDSGDSQPQLGISKAGDRMVRKLLVGSAQFILGPFGPDTDLRRFGMKLCERGGKNAKKRAAVAVARKLAVLLHRLWASGEVYEPLGHKMPTSMAQAAAA